MSQKEKIVIALVLIFVIIIVGGDLATDSREGSSIWHLIAESSVALSAIVALFYLFRTNLIIKHKFEEQSLSLAQLKKDAENWKEESKKYIQGLAEAIDKQLTKWQLTSAEKEVAFLLLKGLSLKEIAEVRGTSEKTVRVQSTAIYTKAGVAGRSELSAFFLEDLLVPSIEKK